LLKHSFLDEKLPSSLPLMSFAESAIFQFPNASRGNSSYSRYKTDFEELELLGKGRKVFPKT
jgi:hypothetical protein